MPSIKELLIAPLSARQRERLRHLFIARQVARGEPIREKEIDLIRALVGPGDRALDIGANVGLFTRELSLLVKAEGHVYAFEPVRSNYEILSAVIRRLGLANVTPFNLALGDTTGTRIMIIPESGSNFVGYYQAHFDSSNAEAGQREGVLTATLDDLHARKAIPAVDFVKCDVEGAEVGVLKGGATFIRDSKPAFMIEVAKNTSRECFELLFSMDYRCYVYDGKVRQVDSYRDGEFSNYFFFHPTSKYVTRLQA